MPIDILVKWNLCYYIIRYITQLVIYFDYYIDIVFPQGLKESFNYGLYCPSVGGKAGKFLDEERPLKDYPLAGPVGFLEVRSEDIRILYNCRYAYVYQLQT